MDKVAGLAQSVGDLLEKLQAGDFFERESAVKALAMIQEDEAIAGLVLALEDPDPGIRELAADQLAGLNSETAVELLIRFLANDDIGSRNLASETLVRIGDSAVPALVKNLETDDQDVRKFICDILGLIHDSRAVVPLRKRLTDSSANVVCSAAEALGALRATEAVDDLIALATRSEDVSLPAVEALGKVGDSRALPFLSECLDSGDAMIRFAAVEAMGHISSTESLPMLQACLSESDRALREAAVMSIVRLSNRYRGNIDVEVPFDEYRTFLLEEMRAGNEEIVQFVVDHLSGWSSVELIGDLLDILDYLDGSTLRDIAGVISGSGPQVGEIICSRLETAEASQRVKLLDLLKPVIDESLALKITWLAADGDHEIRQRLAYVLGFSGCTDAIDTLIELARDTVGHVRAAAFTSLGWLCGRDDAAFLFTGLDDPYPDVREAAVGALIIVGGSEVVRRFTQDLTHSDTERQRLAVTALGWIGEADVVEPLLGAINNPDPTIRRSAINSLARIGNVSDIGPIVHALTDENSAVRKAAVTTLLMLRGERALPQVGALLDDDDVWVRYHTIGAIGELGGDACVNLILPYTQDDQDIIRIAAAKALARPGNQRAAETLKELQNDRNVDLASTAQQALHRIRGES